MNFNWRKGLSLVITIVILVAVLGGLAGLCTLATMLPTIAMWIVMFLLILAAAFVMGGIT